MRGPVLKILACLLALSAVTMSTADAAQRTGTKKNRHSRPDADKAYNLDDIMKDPKTYIHREVFFYARFATTANLFKNINTRFNQNEHVNFAVWPDKTVLWDEEGRKNLLPTLYVWKNDPEMMEFLRVVKKYELIAITAEVQNVYAGYPWLQVKKIEAVEVPSDQICAMVIEHMQNATDALRAESGGVAARHFEQALQFGIPAEFRAKVYEQAAQAYLLDNNMAKAREFLRQAVEANRGDAILHLALADVALKMDDPDEALAHAEFAKENSGRHPQVYGIIGEAYAMKGDYAKAFSNLTTAAGTPGITPREKSMISVRRARIYTLACRFPDAARVYAAASEPGEPLAGEGWLHNEIGLFYERLYLETGDERYLDSAYAAYEESTRLSRMDPSLIYNQTETEFRRQRLSEMPDFTLVRELVERINQVEPDYPPARIVEGRILFAEDKMEEAEYRYQAVVSQIGEEPIALLALAEAYIDLGRYMDAANTVRRARMLQPWHPRVKALGKFIEETAMAIAAAESETRFDGWLNPPGGAQGYPSAGSLGARRGSPNQHYAQGREMRPDAASDPRIARGLARRPAQEPAYAEERPEPQRRRSGGSQNLARSRNGGSSHERQDDLYGAPSRTVRVRPGEGIRVSSSGVSRAEPDEDIQAAARPAPSEGRSGYPVTEVRLPNQIPGEPKPLNLGYRAAGEERYESRGDDRGSPSEAYAREDDDADIRRSPAPERRREYEDSRDDDRGYESRREPARDEQRYVSRSEPPRYGSRDREYDSRYDSREDRYNDQYERGGRDGRDGYSREDRYDSRRAGEEERGERSERRSSRRYDDEQEYRQDTRRSYRDDRDYDRDYEADYDSDGYLRFGQAAGSGQAYGSLIVPDDSGVTENEEGDGVMPPFSFRPDTSPVIIAKVRAPGAGRREMPVRNANVFRPLGAGRQPAEIIEKDAVSPRGNNDTSVMAPPGSGAVRRTEVRLPSTAVGVGMTSDYSPEG